MSALTLGCGPDLADDEAGAQWLEPSLLDWGITMGWFRRAPTRQPADPVEFQQAALEREKHLSTQREILIQSIRVIVEDEQAKLRVRLDRMKLTLPDQLRDAIARFVNDTGVLKVPLALSDFMNERAKPVVQRSFSELLEDSLGGFRRRIQAAVSQNVHVSSAVGPEMVEDANSAVAIEYAKVVGPLLAGVAAAIATPFAAVTTTLIVFTSVSWPLMIGLGALTALLAGITGKGMKGLEQRLTSAIHDRIWPPIAEAIDGKGWKDPQSKKAYASIETQLLAAFRDGGDQAIAKTRLASKRLEAAFRKLRKDKEAEIRRGEVFGTTPEIVEEVLRRALQETAEVE
jgi:hypothetical protein